MQTLKETTMHPRRHLKNGSMGQKCLNINVHVVNIDIYIYIYIVI